MDSLFTAALCLLAGFVLRRLGRLPKDSDRVVSGVVIQLCAPPVTFLAARTMPISWEMLLPASMAWIIFAGALVLFGLLRRPLGLTRETFGCLMLTAAMSNVVFIGLPMIEALFGREYIYIAFLCDSPGTSLVLALPGVLLASYLAKKKDDTRSTWAQVRVSLLRVVTFPPFQGLVLGFALGGVEIPQWTLLGLAHIGAALVPLSLFSVGLGIKLILPRRSLGPLAAGLGYKLVLAPLLMWAVAALVFGNTGMVAKVTVLEAAMPPMILGAILATEHDLDADLAALMVGLGTPLAFLTLPLWRLALDWM